MLSKPSDNQYPIGQFVLPAEINDTVRNMWIGMLSEFPQKLNKELHTLDVEEYDTPYRDGGWTVRQVVHHLADSHINGYTRTRLALTENNPVIRPYLEARWAELEDASTAPVHISLSLLESVHLRWAMLFQAMDEQDFKKQYFHPENNRNYTLEEQLGLYVWHGRHHLAHIRLVSVKALVAAR